MAAEAAAYHKKEGKTLYHVLNELFEKHGFYQEGLKSLTLKGKEGAEQIQGIQDNCSKNAFLTVERMNSLSS